MGEASRRKKLGLYPKQTPKIRRKARLNREVYVDVARMLGLGGYYLGLSEEEERGNGQ